MLFIQNTSELFRLDNLITQAKSVAVDTETHAGHKLHNDIWAALRVVSLGIRLSSGTLEGVVIDVKDIDMKRLGESLAKIRVAVAWNANFEDLILRENGLPALKWWDAMLADAVLFGGSYGFVGYCSLAKATKAYLGRTMSGKGTIQTSFDAMSPLTQKQIEYAASDAVSTLEVAEAILKELRVQNLTRPVALEQAARPFIAQMTEKGLFFDALEWDRVLLTYQAERDAALEDLKTLTGETGLQEMTWKPTYEVDIKNKFNIYAPDVIQLVLGKDAQGRPRLLGPTTKLDKAFLQECILKASREQKPKYASQVALIKALLKFRSNEKILTTYGANLYQYLADDGRLHPEYKQAITDTGRLLSKNPNAQNFSPALKPYLRPETPDRVFVHCDLSQAEVRVLAHLSHEEAMLNAFKQAQDFHVITAERMFSVDMSVLKATNPSSYDHYRRIAKSITFGIPYGLGAVALARKLTLETGREISATQAQKYLDSYLETYPKVAQWLAKSDNRIKEIAANVTDIDWALTMRLGVLKKDIADAQSQLKRNLKVEATTEELLDALLPPSASTKDREQLEQEINWAQSFIAPIVIKNDGKAFSFESRTLSSRRRLFEIPLNSSTAHPTSGIVINTIFNIALSKSPPLKKLWQEFVKENDLKAPLNPVRSFSGPDVRQDIIKAFSGKNANLKMTLLDKVSHQLGFDTLAQEMDGALRGEIRKYANAYRNVRIQSLVSDIMLEGFSNLQNELAIFKDAFPVQSVHDSVVIECFAEDAPEVAIRVRDTMEKAMNTFCPSVVAKADVDIRTSLKGEQLEVPLPGEFEKTSCVKSNQKSSPRLEMNT